MRNYSVHGSHEGRKFCKPTGSQVHTKLQILADYQKWARTMPLLIAIVGVSFFIITLIYFDPIEKYWLSLRKLFAKNRVIPFWILRVLYVFIF